MEKLIKEASKKFDKEFDFKKIVGGWIGIGLELFDDNIVRAGLTFAESKLPNQFKDEFKLVLEAYINDDYEAVKTEALSQINQAVDIPYLDEEDEAIILGAVSKALFAILQKRKLKNVTNDVSLTSVGGGGSGDDPTDPDGNDPG